MDVPIEYKIEELAKLEVSILKKKAALRKELGHTLTALLKLKNLTQRQAGEALCISHGTIAAMCNDRAINKPSLTTTLDVYKKIGML